MRFPIADLIDEIKCYSDLKYKAGDLPASEEASENTLALPIYPELTREQQDQVAKVIKDFGSSILSVKI